jgi:hypothetical protein
LNSVLSNPLALGLATTANPHVGPVGDGDGDTDGDGDADGVGRGRGGRWASAGGAATPHNSTAAATAANPASSRPRSRIVPPMPVTLGGAAAGNPYRTVTSQPTIARRTVIQTPHTQPQRAQVGFDADRRSGSAPT